MKFKLFDKKNYNSTCLSEDRIRNGAKKIMKLRTTTTQVRLDSFFKVTSVTPAKRKVEFVNTKK